jgi:peptidyl-prolyl cis-trans isomerase B (cyclophilin B)
MTKLPRVRLVLPGIALAGITALLVACGGDDKPPVASGGATPTPGVSADAKCTGSDKITSIKREGIRSFKVAPNTVIDSSKTYEAVMKTNKGDIKLSLYAKEAPITVNNFVFLACEGFYDGLIFHRVVKEPQPFVIQGGDPRGNGSGGPGYIFNDEISTGLKHELGTLSMANAGPNTNGSQFFITLAPQPALDGKYNVFGKVTDGQSVVNNIAIGDRVIGVSITEK